MSDVSLIGTNSGHGHAWARPDGVKMRCGGPRMCKVCGTDAAMVAATLEAGKSAQTKDVRTAVVPVEPTEAMRRAGYDITERRLAPAWTALSVWSAMLSAAPAQPGSRGEGEAVAWLTTGGDVTRSHAYAVEQSVNDPDNYPKALVRGDPLPAASQPSVPGDKTAGSEGQWQPIETAPVEDRVLIFRPSVFDEDRIFHASLDSDGWWTVHDGKHDHNLRGAQPTHWMPLPAAPEAGHD